MKSLFGLLMICLFVCFGYPLFGKDSNLVGLAILLGAFGAIITFFAILIKACEEKKIEFYGSEIDDETLDLAEQCERYSKEAIKDKNKEK